MKLGSPEAHIFSLSHIERKLNGNWSIVACLFRKTFMRWCQSGLWWGPWGKLMLAECWWGIAVITARHYMVSMWEIHLTRWHYIIAGCISVLVLGLRNVSDPLLTYLVTFSNDVVTWFGLLYMAFPSKNNIEPINQSIISQSINQSTFVTLRN